MPLASCPGRALPTWPRIPSLRQPSLSTSHSLESPCPGRANPSVLGPPGAACRFLALMTAVTTQKRILQLLATVMRSLVPHLSESFLSVPPQPVMVWAFPLARKNVHTSHPSDLSSTDSTAGLQPPCCLASGGLPPLSLGSQLYWSLCWLLLRLGLSPSPRLLCS